MKVQTLFFTFAVAVYVGVTAAVTFAASIHFAFGWVLGQLFIWAALVGFISWIITRIGLRRERAWWDARMEGEAAFGPGEKKKRFGEEGGEMGNGATRDRDVKEKRDPQGSGTAVDDDRDDSNDYRDEKKKPYENGV
jgi:hypothetical protein